MKNKTVSVVMPLHICKKLEDLAKEQHRSLSGQIMHYIMLSLREIEEWNRNPSHQLRATNDNHLKMAAHLDPSQKHRIEFRKRIREMMDEILCSPDILHATGLLGILEEEMVRAHQIWKIRNEFDGGTDSS